MKHVAIIGNGISGVTAARHIRKLDSHTRITLISGETDHAFSRTALMYIFMGQVPYKGTKLYEDFFWQKNRIDLVRGWVTSVDFDGKQLQMANGSPIAYDALVLATGSKPNKFGWPGQDLKGVQGLYSYQDLEMLEENVKGAKKAVIVGGGLIGIEMAEMLLYRKVDVTFLVREQTYWGKVLPKEESEMIGQHILTHHVDLQLGTELKEIVSDANGRVKAAVTSKGETIDCQIVGLTAGVSPNIEFLKQTPLETNRGILVDECLRTNMPDVYAIGDCAEFKQPNGLRRPIEQVWYTGRMMGETVAQTICGKATRYTPGEWFNSAKFFDIEYQTYGWVWAAPKENEASFHWKHPEKDVLFRANFDKTTEELIGINCFGMRLRHEVFDRWLREKKHIDHVMQHLHEAHFDPEFYKRHEDAIIGKFNQEFGKSLKSSRKKGLLAAFGL